MNIRDFYASAEERPLDRLLSDGGFTGIFKTVCCIGDSLSSGEFESVRADGTRDYTDMYEYSWGQYIARMCGNEVYNFSRGGLTARAYCDSFAESKDFWNKDLASQAYIIAFGVNDLYYQHQEIGDVSSIDFNDWRNNKDNFAGRFAEIIQRMKEISPDAKFFLVTMPKEEDPEDVVAMKEGHRELLYSLAEAFSNTYVIDLYGYAPVYDKEFKKNFYLHGHLNPMGYILTAKMIASYIDYIIRQNPEDFYHVPFIGTDILSR